MGPGFSNTYANVQLSSGSAISNSDTRHLFFVDNRSAVTINLPHANVAGKFIRIEGTCTSACVNTFTVNVASGSGDLIVVGFQPNGPVTTTGAARGLEFISDGAGKWYEAESQ